MFQVRKLYLRERDQNGSIIVQSAQDDRDERSAKMSLAHKAARVPMWYVKERIAGNA